MLNIGDRNVCLCHFGRGAKEREEKKKAFSIQRAGISETELLVGRFPGLAHLSS